MFLHPALRVVSRVLPEVASGRALHRRALAAFAVRDDGNAERWFGAAAAMYRLELNVEPLARLRVHQLMARARADRTGAGESAAMIEIVRRLNRLDRLEMLEAPFELADARTVLTQWIEQADTQLPAGAGLLSAVAPAA